MRLKLRRNRKDEFDVFFPQHIYHKMLAYAKVCDGEISGWGKTKITRDKNAGVTHVTVTDVRIFNQTVTSAHTSLSTDTMTKFYVGLIKDGEDVSMWNLWWHSHNDFGVFFSAEDDDTIKTVSKATRLYSICINKKGELVARVDDYGKTVAEHMDPRVENPVQETLMASCRAEVKKKVKREKFVTHPLVYVGGEELGEGFTSFYRGPGYVLPYTPPFTPTHEDHRIGAHPNRDARRALSTPEDNRFPSQKKLEWYDKHIFRHGSAR